MGNLYLSNADSISQFAVKTFSAQNAGHEGNPYDILATVTYTHTATSTEITVEMYYDGGDTWRWRFCGTLVGEWTYTTASAETNLNGLSGNITVNDALTGARGFVLAEGSKYAIQIPTGTKSHVYNVWINENDYRMNGSDGGDTLINWRNEEVTRTNAYADEALAHGCAAIFAHINNQWLAIGHNRWDTHSSVDPDRETFEMLESIINTARAKGVSVHIWMWGDEDRKWTQIGLDGGINGVVDQRIQRYICARLGPVPGWTISYGFDLQEWVTQAQVETWGNYMLARLGWPKMLMARTEGIFTTPDNLPVNSQDNRPSSGFYTNAETELARTPTRPTKYERRFLYNRDNVWDMQTTRRAMWQFAIAGGATAHWGPLWGDNTPYSNPEQMAAHRLFWKDRLLLDMTPDNDLTNGWALADTNDHYVFYREGVASIDLDLSGASSSLPAVAIDTLLAYAEIDIGPLSATNQTWTAPYSSDWVVAVGTFT
jgi:hypothetical protein